MFISKSKLMLILAFAATQLLSYSVTHKHSSLSQKSLSPKSKVSGKIVAGISTAVFSLLLIVSILNKKNTTEDKISKIESEILERLNFLKSTLEKGRDLYVEFPRDLDIETYIKPFFYKNIESFLYKFLNLSVDDCTFFNENKKFLDSLENRVPSKCLEIKKIFNEYILFIDLLVKCLPEIKELFINVKKKNRPLYFLDNEFPAKLEKHLLLELDKKIKNKIKERRELLSQYNELRI